MEISRYNPELDGRRTSNYVPLLKIKSTFITPDTKYIKNVLNKYQITGRNASKIPLVNDYPDNGRVYLFVRNDIHTKKIESALRDVIDTIKEKEEKEYRKIENKNKWFNKLIKNTISKHDPTNIQLYIKEKSKFDYGVTHNPIIGIHLSEDFMKVYDIYEPLFIEHSPIHAYQEQNEFTYQPWFDTKRATIEETLNNFIDHMFKTKEKIDIEKIGQISEMVSNIIEQYSSNIVHISIDRPYKFRNNQLHDMSIQMKFKNDTIQLKENVHNKILKTTNVTIEHMNYNSIYFNLPADDIQTVKKNLTDVLDITKKQTIDSSQQKDEITKYVKDMKDKINEKYKPNITASITYLASGIKKQRHAQIQLSPKCIINEHVEKRIKSILPSDIEIFFTSNNRIELNIPWNTDKDLTRQKIMKFCDEANEYIETEYGPNSSLDELYEKIITAYSKDE
jgi:hypothetical protein